MTSSFINNSLLHVLFIATLIACRQKSGHDHSADLHGSDSSLNAEIQKINRGISAPTETIKPEAGTKIFSVTLEGVVSYDTRNAEVISSRVDGRIEKLYVRYNMQPIRRGQKILEIYSPQLAAAQREMLYLAQQEEADLLGKAKERVRLLGFTNAQIADVLQSRKVRYSMPVYSNIDGYVLVGAGDSMNQTGTAFTLSEGAYVMAGQTLFNIYNSKRLVAEFSIPPGLAPHISQGAELLFHPSYNKNLMQEGTIGLMEPVLRNGEQFNVARVYIRDNNFNVGDVIQGTTPVKLNGWWVPASAVWKQGARAIVYRKRGDTFEPQYVDVQTIINGQALLNVDVSDWVIASNASFFKDSDSFVQTKNNEK